jgi:hypothetical protein
LTLVAAVIFATLPFIGLAAIQYQEGLITAAEGNHIGQIGQALNLYISANSTALGAGAAVQTPAIGVLQAANSCGTGITCLPTSVSTTNSFGTTYNLMIHKIGTTAPYQFEGLVVTSTPWITNGKVRADLAGAAAIGVAGGNGGTVGGSVNGCATLCASGVGGAWGGSTSTLTAANYPATITGAAQVAYYVNTATSNLDLEYLRVDGTNKMLAALNVGNNAINNATVLNVPAGGNGINLGGSYIYGDGTNMAMRTANTVYMQNTAGTSNSAAIQAGSLQTQLGVTAGTTVAAGSTVTAGTNVNAGNTVNATNAVTAQGGKFQTYVNGTYSTGVYMQSGDGTAQRLEATPGGGSRFTNGPYTAQLATLDASGNFSAAYDITAGYAVQGQFVYPQSVAGVGGACGPNGYLSKTATGLLLECASGIWTDVTNGVGTYYFMGNKVGAYTGSNTGVRSMMVQVHGGYAASGLCNAYYLLAQVPVGGAAVAQAIDNDNNAAKQGDISFWVGPGQTYHLTSTPYACGAGLMVVEEYRFT